MRSFLLLVLVSCGCVRAEVVPGRWEKLDSSYPGKPIIVTLKAGDRIEGTFNSSGLDYLAVLTQGGTELRVPKSQVREVISGEKYDDGTRDGTLIGLVAGFAGGAAFGGALSERVDLIAKFTIPFFGGVGAGVGALLGYVADKSHKGTEVLYRAPR